MYVSAYLPRYDLGQRDIHNEGWNDGWNDDMNDGWNDGWDADGLSLAQWLELDQLIDELDHDIIEAQSFNHLPDHAAYKHNRSN